MDKQNPYTHYAVYRNHESNTFGVYRQPATNGTGCELVHGGFAFKRDAVELARALNASK